MLNPARGDLVHIPSSVMLKRYDLPGRQIMAYQRTEHPAIAVFLENFDNNHCRIYYNGEYWVAHERDVYMNSEVKNVC